MTSGVRLMALLGVGLTIAATHGVAQACTLSVTADLRRPASRIAFVRIEIPNAAVQSVGNIQAGWNFVIDNELTWKATLSAHAILGVAFVDDLDFIPTLRLTPQPGHSCAALDRAQAARFYLQRYVNDGLQDETLDPALIRISE